MHRGTPGDRDPGVPAHSGRSLAALPPKVGAVAVTAHPVGQALQEGAARVRVHRLQAPAHSGNGCAAGDAGGSATA
ncbi:hypothetical protein CD790_33240 [Streptomyces sp. SAJ15]|nr:hypothetical protein CD790_33240 [Streptomyces sp. SAJ15]